MVEWKEMEEEKEEKEEEKEEEEKGLGVTATGLVSCLQTLTETLIERET